jgi:hypothetical protein
LYGALVSRLQTACKRKRHRWHGLRPLAADKTTLALPETKSLWKQFGGHKGQQGLGPIAVELCCLFDLISRAPLHFAYSKCCTSEHKLVQQFIRVLKKRDLLLIDSGFYSGATFAKILQRLAHFMIPASKTISPKVLRNLGPGDYLCLIKDSNSSITLTVRVLFVYRQGFRRRRLVTSLLDPELYPAPELARLYHMRWDIETFYRDFKHTFHATCWHCQTPDSFHRELLVHMIAFCLIRLAMLEASRMANAPVGHLSFARALTETRLFFRMLITSGEGTLWDSVWAAFVECCSRHRVRSKPDRQFTRDRQEYRRKSRGLEQRKRGRKPEASQKASILDDRPEMINDSKGRAYLLS